MYIIECTTRIEFRAATILMILLLDYNILVLSFFQNKQEVIYKLYEKIYYHR